MSVQLRKQMKDNHKRVSSQLSKTRMNHAFKNFQAYVSELNKEGDQKEVKIAMLEKEEAELLNRIKHTQVIQQKTFKNLEKSLHLQKVPVYDRIAQGITEIESEQIEDIKNLLDTRVTGSVALQNIKSVLSPRQRRTVSQNDTFRPYTMDDKK